MVSKEISDFGKEARAGSAQSSFQNYNQGSQNASGLMNDSGSFDRGLASQNPEMSAIKQKYNTDFGRNQKRLSLSLMKQGEEDHLRKVQIANQMASEEMQINQQKEMLKWQRKQAKKMARAQTIGSVLGIVGAGAGLATTGTAAGGMVGYSIGQGVGGAAAGSL